MSFIEDKILLWRTQRGDAEALGRIYEKYRAAVVSVAAAMLGDREAAEDVLKRPVVLLDGSTGQCVWVLDGFQWGSNLDRSEFEPVIPPDYTPYVPPVIPREKAATFDANDPRGQ